MSLSAWEQHALDSISDGLADSDPELATLLATFTRLESGEEMPARENILAGSWRVARRPHRSRRHPRRGTPRWPAPRAHRYLGLHRAAVVLWLLITAALIAVAVALSSGGGQGACAPTWVAACPSPAPARGSPPPAVSVAVDPVTSAAGRLTWHE